MGRTYRLLSSLRLSPVFSFIDSSLLSEQFCSPWADLEHEHTGPPDHLPDHYKALPVPSPNLILQQMTKFSNETLFHMFYSLPGDMMQNAAAMEL